MNSGQNLLATILIMKSVILTASNVSAGNAKIKSYHADPFSGSLICFVVLNG